ncbi:MAG: hypothetical protein MRZ79_00810 [Bacteroidia bacterium]|nr:hypothetical protein [Bacteroidia bacterium]
MEDWLGSLIYATKWVVFIPFVVGLIRWRQLHISQKLIFGLTVVAILAELSSLILSRTIGNNLVVLHIFVLLEFILLTLAFSRGYRNYISRNGELLIISGFGLICILNVIFFQGLFEYSSNTRTLEAIFLIAMAMGFFVLSLKRLDIKDLNSHPMFWVSAGVLLYFTANLLLFIYSNYVGKLGQSSEIGALTFKEIWAIHGILNTILYLFYTRAILCHWKESQ